MERVFSGVNPQSLITLGEARGVLLLALARAAVPVHEVTPAEIKKTVTGTGQAGQGAGPPDGALAPRLDRRGRAPGARRRRRRGCRPDARVPDGGRTTGRSVRGDLPRVRPRVAG